MTVTLLYFDGCPHWKTAEVHLRAALARAGRHLDIEHVLVETAEDAERLGFPGSPTILVDGRDPFDEGAAPALACRVFATPTGLAGAPTVEQLVDVLG